MTDEPERHQVAITVFMTADGADYQDASMVARMVLRRAIRAATGETRLPATLSAVTAYGVTVRADVHEVMETGSAARNGYLWVQPTHQAYPRDEED